MKTIHPGHLEHRFCIFGCQILCITDLAIMPPYTKCAMKKSQRWQRRCVQLAAVELVFLAVERERSQRVGVRSRPVSSG